MATSRPSRVSLARYTSPIPPAPSGATISYGPNLLPVVSKGSLARTAELALSATEGLTYPETPRRELWPKCSAQCAFSAPALRQTPQIMSGLANQSYCDADGKLDVVVASGGGTATPGGSGISVSLGNGDGTFTQANGSPLSLGQFLSAIVAADFNGDGKLDIAVTDSVNNTVMILLGNGDGSFGPPLTIPVGKQPNEIIAGDFNNDGKLDLAIANQADGTVTLLVGNGDGTFTQAVGSPYTVSVPNGLFQIAAADFNGDGKLDLAVANLLTYSVSIFLQQ